MISLPSTCKTTNPYMPMSEYLNQSVRSTSGAGARRPPSRAPRALRGLTQIPHCDLCAKGTRRCRATMRATHTCTMVESRENSSQHAHIHDCRGLLLRVLALERHCAKKCFCAHHQRVERGCVHRLSREACTAAVITVSTGLGFLRCMRGSSKLSGRAFL